jgi:hypothetical protein
MALYFLLLLYLYDESFAVGWRGRLHCRRIELNQFIEASISLPQEGSTDAQPTPVLQCSVYGN